MNFKYYDTLSMLVCGVVMLFVVSLIFDWDISQINTVGQLAIAYVVGYLLNAVGSLLEPIYWGFMGGRPSSELLKAPRPAKCGEQRTYTGLRRIRFYEYERVISLLKDELKDNDADERKMFERAKSYSNSDETTRVPDFNAQYAFSRVVLTLALVSSCLVVTKYYDMLWVWGIAVVGVLLTGRRCKERAYYYAREVLIEYLKINQFSSGPRNEAKRKDSKV